MADDVMSLAPVITVMNVPSLGRLVMPSFRAGPGRPRQVL
jgi:hypothetical protein